MLNGRTFNELSSFYLNMWQYMNTYFNDNRWLQLAPTSQSKDERFRLLEQSFEFLRRNELEGSLYKQVRQDFAQVRELQREFAVHKHQPGDEWFKRADKIRTYSQELGLRYAELATSET